MNIKITSTVYTVKVEFNALSAKTGIKSVSYRRNEISEVVEVEGATYVSVIMLDGNSFNVSYAPQDIALVVDTIDGVSITDNDDLFNKLVALQQV